MNLKTFIDLYGPDVLSKADLLEEINTVKKTHIDTIPSVIKDLDEIMTSQSQGSKSIISSNGARSQYPKDTFSYNREKSDIGSEKKIIMEADSDSKDPPSDSGFSKQKDVITFSNDKLSSHKFRKSQSPAQFERERNGKHMYSPTSQLGKTDREQDLTETTQQYDTLMKKIIKDAGIEFSDDAQPDWNPPFPSDAHDKPSFFETGVDIPPYLQPKADKLKEGNKVVYNNLRDDRIYNIRESRGSQFALSSIETVENSDYIQPQLHEDQSFAENKGKTLLKNRRRIHSRF